PGAEAARQGRGLGAEPPAVRGGSVHQAVDDRPGRRPLRPGHQPRPPAARVEAEARPAGRAGGDSRGPQSRPARLVPCERSGAARRTSGPADARPPRGLTGTVRLSDPKAFRTAAKTDVDVVPASVRYKRSCAIWGATTGRVAQGEICRTPGAGDVA